MKWLNSANPRTFRFGGLVHQRRFAPITMADLSDHDNRNTQWGWLIIRPRSEESEYSG